MSRTTTRRCIVITSHRNAHLVFGMLAGMFALMFATVSPVRAEGISPIGIYDRCEGSCGCQPKTQSPIVTSNMVVNECGGPSGASVNGNTVNAFNWSESATLSADGGTLAWQDGSRWIRSAAPLKNLGTPSPGTCKGNPCDAATGNKFEVEQDQSGNGGLGLVRYYNSQSGTDLGFGMGWTSSLLGKRLLVGPTLLQAVRADAKGEPFSCSANTCTGDTDSHYTLVPDASGYTLAHKDGARERYDLNGKLLNETDAAGRTISYSYDNVGRVSMVIGPFGHTFVLGYDASNHVTSITNTAGLIFGYTYDVNKNLVRVSYPDGTAKLYFYENTNLRNHLTGISYVEANGTTTRYGTYSYNASSKASSSEHAGGMERISLTYSDTQTTVLDAANNAEVFTFQTNLGQRNLTARTNAADGKSLAQTFDNKNNLTCRQDDEGRVITFVYNSTNQLTSMTEGLGGNCAAPLSTAATRTTTYQYVSATINAPTLVQQPSVYSGNVKSDRITYGDGRFPTLPTEIARLGFTPSGAAVSRSVSLTYNALGQVTSIDGARTDTNDVTTLVYYSCATGGACGQLQSITNALGQVTTFNAYDANGRITQITDSNGTRTNYIYDARGRVTSITATPSSGAAARTTIYSYNAANNVTSVTFPDGMFVVFTYDAAQKLRQITDNQGNKIVYGYDLKGNRTQEVVYDPGNTLVRQIDLAYDLRNHVSSINNGGSVTQQVVDAVGNLTRQTDPNQVAAGGSVHTTFQYDALNRLLASVNNLGGTTGLTYDKSDNLTQAVAPNNATTTYAYDDLGNLLSETSPDRGAITYTHDAAGNVTTVADARGITISHTYDALNRLTRINHPTDTDVTFTYDTNASGLSCGQGLGRLCKVVDESGATEYTYDAFGNVLTQRHSELSRAYVTRYTYDAGNRISTITYPDNRVVTYTRDGLGRAQSITATVSGSATTIVSNRLYRSDGLLLSQTYGNGLNEVRQYNLKGELTYQSLGADTRVYAYDWNGNLTQKQTIPEVGNYTYDKLDRLTQDQLVTSGTSNQTYIYDANGNRTKKGSAVYTYTANSNRLIQAGSASITYDAAGNALTKDASSYTYSDAGRLRTARASGTLKGTYTYNYLGLRTRKVAGSTTTLYHYDLAGNLILETSSAAVTKAAYVYVDDVPLAQVKRVSGTDTLVHLHADQLDTPRLATHATNQNIVWRWDGRAFGDTGAKQDPDGNGTTTTVNLRYPGQYYDSETGLFYNHHRYYAPGLGRYITSDPIGLNGGLNTYAYVHDNPLRYVDRDGNQARPSWGQLPRRELSTREKLQDLFVELPRGPRTPCDIYPAGCLPQRQCVKWICTSNKTATSKSNAPLGCKVKDDQPSQTWPPDKPTMTVPGYHPSTSGELCICTDYDWKRDANGLIPAP